LDFMILEVFSNLNDSKTYEYPLSFLGLALRRAEKGSAPCAGAGSVLVWKL